MGGPPSSTAFVKSTMAVRKALWRTGGLGGFNLLQYYNFGFAEGLLRSNPLHLARLESYRALHLNG